MKKMIQITNKYFAELCGWLLMIMMGLLVIDFVSRKIYYPIQGVAEISVFVLVAAVYLGIPHCEQMKEHVKIDALMKRLPIRLRKIIDSAVYLSTSLFLIILVFSVGQNFVQSYQSREVVAGTTPLVIWPVKLTIFVGVFFYCMQVMISTIDEFKKNNYYTWFKSALVKIFNKIVELVHINH